MDLEELLRSAPIWRGRGGPHHSTHSPTLATGLAALDQALPGGGWPLGALIEIMLERHGLGELKLLMPALASLSRERVGNGRHPQRWIVWVAPPFIPYAPALASYGLELDRMLWVHPPQNPAGDDNSEVLWAMEQALRSGSSAAVLAWVKRTDSAVLRRLQLAAEEGSSLAVLFRPEAAMRESSPAALRLALRGGDVGTDVEVLKCRRGKATTLRNLLVPSLMATQCIQC